jgi:hypothetical protein
MVYEIQQSVLDALSNLWAGFVEVLPVVLGALVVLIVGWLIALSLGRLAVRIIDVLQVDKAVHALKITSIFERSGMKLNVAELIGWLVKWFFLVVFFLAAADILGWAQVSLFLGDVLAYIPNVIIAAVILLVGILFANFTHEAVRTSVDAAELESGHFLAGLSKWAILIFALFAALNQLSIAEELIQLLLTGFIAMVAIGGGLAFGLGGKEQAGTFLKKLKKDISK